MVNIYGVAPMDVEYIKPYGLDLEEDKLDYIISQLQDEATEEDDDKLKEKEKQEKYLDDKNMKVLKDQIEEILAESITLQ